MDTHQLAATLKKHKGIAVVSGVVIVGAVLYARRSGNQTGVSGATTVGGFTAPGVLDAGTDSGTIDGGGGTDSGGNFGGSDNSDAIAGLTANIGDLSDEIAGLTTASTGTRRTLRKLRDTDRRNTKVTRTNTKVTRKNTQATRKNTKALRDRTPAKKTTKGATHGKAGGHAPSRVKVAPYRVTSPIRVGRPITGLKATAPVRSGPKKVAATHQQQPRAHRGTVGKAINRKHGRTVKAA